MTKTICWSLACVALFCTPLAAVASPLTDEPSAADKGHLAPVARFVGGQWMIHGHWSNGEELRARSIYEWGIANKIIVAKTYVMNGDKEYQRYEGILTWHPKKKSLVQFSFAYNGDLSETIMDAKDKDTIYVGWTPYNDGQPANVRQILKFKDDNSFVWTVAVKNGDKWEQIMEGTWERKDK
jgi:hypothetical protein